MRYFSIGKCIIAVDNDHSMNNTFNDNVNKFEVYNKSSYDIYIKHLFSKCIDEENEIIYTNENWIIKHHSEGYFYHYIPYNIKAIVNKKMDQWKIYVPSDFREHYNDGYMRDLCLFYSDQVMIYPWLIKNKGLILHGNGLVKDNKGIILLGKSGSGKTTLTKMLINNGWSLLCDDRTIIIDDNMYGHWCHGSYNIVNKIDSKFQYVMFLNHSLQSVIKPCTKVNFIDNVVGYLNMDYMYVINKYARLCLNKGVSFMDVSFNLSGDIINKINNL